MSDRFAVSGVFSAMEVAASGLTAERGRMNVIASKPLERPDDQGRRRKPLPPPRPRVRFEAGLSRVVRPRSPQRSRGQAVGRTSGYGSRSSSCTTPGHPDANADGYVQYPNVSVVTEMVNLMTASRSVRGRSDLDRIHQSDGPLGPQDRNISEVAPITEATPPARTELTESATGASSAWTAMYRLATSSRRCRTSEPG